MKRILFLFLVSLSALQAAETPVSFQRDVMPVFFRANCNSGGCHGAASGKDGFRLSLFGYDAAGDYYRLTQQMIGRRIDVARPEKSLLLLKSINAVPHTGGKLFDEKSEYYATLLRWLQQGAPNDQGIVPQVTGISLEPPKVLFEKPSGQRALKVIAAYSDGTKRDVSTLALYSSNNKTVADIKETGEVVSGIRGATDVFARFGKYTVGGEIIVLPQGDQFLWPKDIQAKNYIDELVHSRLQKLRILPSEICTDEQFLRRVTLDLIGLPPSKEEYFKFMADPVPDKRERLVDALLTRPEYADVWASKWGDWVKIVGETYDQYGTDEKAALAYFQWLNRQFQQNTPLGQFVRDQIASRGSTFQQPEVNLFTMLPAGEYAAKSVAQDVAQLFTGMRIQCAECHNHPFDRWTQDDYYGFVSFFTGIKRKTAREPREFYIYNDNSAPPAPHLLDQRPMPPKFLGGEAPDTAGKDPRVALAAWLTAPGNTLFSKNMANRIWAHFLGRGVVEPIDDFRINNPPSNSDLLDGLAAKLASYKFDQKRLIRDIVTSRTYQLSARVNPTNRSDERQFSHATVRRLPSVTALDTVSAATGVETEFKEIPAGLRAAQVYDTGRKHGSYFLTAFGQSERKTVCVADDVTDPSFAQSLHLINGDTIATKLKDNPLLKMAMQQNRTPAEIVEALFIRTLARKPTKNEWTAFSEAVIGAEPKATAKPEIPRPETPAPTLKPTVDNYTNLWWSLFNSTEFLFQH